VSTETDTNTYAAGDGNSHLGAVQSYAGLGGYKFDVGAGETFPFNFSTFLYLVTFADHLSKESENTFGQVAFQIYQNSDDSATFLDTFFVTGNLNSSGNSIFLNSDITFLK
jgi:hypothetical protein